jgi:hypothetical protein
MTWLGSAADIASKGSTAKKAGSLAGLHTRRRETKGQFFTDGWIGEGIWSVLNSLVASTSESRPLSVVDTSIGSGRLLANANTERCRLFGLDVDERCIQALSGDADEAGLNYQFEVGRLEDLEMRGFDIAVINPPFSLTVQSPLMTAYRCTGFGPFGPNTTALSHEYALAQGLDGAAVVAAVLPASMEAYCRDEKRLAAIYRLPNDAFKQENAEVSTAVFVFDSVSRNTEVVEMCVEDGTPWDEVSLSLSRREAAVFKLGGIDESAPTITLPVTGDRRVRLSHHNRRVVIKFECGLTQAKVMNAILDDDVRPGEKHRYPKGVRYRGDARLWLDVMLLQQDPQAAFDSLISTIENNGGKAEVSATLAGYWAKRKRRHARAITPFRQWVKKGDGSELQAVAIRSSMLRMGDLSSPVIKKGEQLSVEPLGGEFVIQKDGEAVTLNRGDFEKRFELLEPESNGEPGWMLIEKGLVRAFPELATQIRRRMEEKGIDWLWPFQEDGLIEHLIKPYGSVAAWKQGTGKARLAIALALLSGKNSLIVVESGLVGEMVKELEDKLNLDQSLWRVIDGDTNIENIRLRQINVASYNTIKKRVRGKKTIAKMLRRRFHTVIADEGGLLANLGSQQSRAVLALAAKKLIVTDGTPIGSYPRDILPVTGACAGDGVAHQPYGLRQGAFVEERLFSSASYMMRGIDQFRERHVVLEWVTNNFKEDNRNGAKREIPRIANVVDFRNWIQPNVQRKVRYEPEVEPYAGCPKPIFETTTVPWDKAHLRHYLDVALHFANWYMAHLRERTEKGKGTNLVAVLARIGAVQAAANRPHKPGKLSIGAYSPLTSKQRAAIEKIEGYVEDGKKTILYATAPSVIERLADELDKRGIKSVRFHGGISIKKRTKALDEEFRFGDTPVLLSTWCGQSGLNIPQGKRMIFYDRNWTGRAEDQAVHRTQRPDQDERVIVDRLHIQGSIDEYIGQVVDWKVAAADSGLDWGDGITETDVFQHLDSIIESFCRDTLDMSSRDAFEALAA